MALPEQILVIVDEVILSDAGALSDLIKKAVYLRDRSDTGELQCRLEVATVVYEPLVDWRRGGADERAGLKQMIVEHTQQRLDEALQAAATDGETVSATALWGVSSWRTILDHAEDIGADLLVKPSLEELSKASGHKAPEDWHLLRHSTAPVLLTSTKPWQEPTAVVVAVDTFAEVHESLNDRLFANAHNMAQILSAHVYIVSTFPRLQPLVAELGMFSEYAEQEQAIQDEGVARVSAAMDQAGIKDAIIDVKAGDPDQAIREVIERVGPAVAVIGTHARTGVRAAFLGNTSEKLIHNLTHQDMLIVR